MRCKYDSVKAPVSTRCAIVLNGDTVATLDGILNKLETVMWIFALNGFLYPCVSTCRKSIHMFTLLGRLTTHDMKEALMLL